MRYVPQPDRAQYDIDWAVLLLLDYGVFFLVVVIPELSKLLR